MKDPLNPAEFEQFLQNVRKTFIDLYQQALKSGALEPQEEHDHTLARCVLVITASKYEPMTKRKGTLENLQHFL